jgi:hypothetical protein
MEQNTKLETLNVLFRTPEIVEYIWNFTARKWDKERRAYEIVVDVKTEGRDQRRLDNSFFDPFG